jgi:large subunit ribosomal protein L5
MAQTPQLQKEYKERVAKALIDKFGYKNIMMVPKLQKIVLSRGIGDAVSDKKLIENSAQEFAMISGQKALITKAKKDVSNFKLRMGMPIGCKVTLRGARMYEFLQRLIHVALPRTRDFRGINPTGFDGRGNYNMGIKEQIIFPEIDVDKINRISGLDITFVTSAKTDEEAFELLKELGMPFKTK